MSAKGGLPPIPIYEIHRNHWLHELRILRSKVRIGSLPCRTACWDRKQFQKHLRLLRKETPYEVR